MAVLDRSELEASPLADLHAIADQVGLDGFRRMRKADLIEAILGGSPEAGSPDGADPADPADGADPADSSDEAPASTRTRRRRPRRSAGSAEREEKDDEVTPDGGSANGERPARRSRARSSRERAERTPASASEAAGEELESSARTAEGVVEVLGNGSAFLRVDPPEPSDEDVYISAAQVRRCELVSGDRVSGPVRTPRRSERYPSLVRIDTINGAPADSVSDGSRYEDLPVTWPSERLALDADDPTLRAIEWLTPLGLGSRAVIVGARHAGKTETLRRLLSAVKGRSELDVTVVLAGAVPRRSPSGGRAPWRPPPRSASPPPRRRRVRPSSARSTPPSGSPPVAGTRSC